MNAFRLAGRPRNSRAFRTDDLFEPGRSILTPVGQTRLDEVGRWCKQATRPNSEVVIAAFTDGDHDEDLAEILTQEQADSCGDIWSTTSIRRPAGSRAARSRRLAWYPYPADPDGPQVNAPSRRVEIILFTPQT